MPQLGCRKPNVSEKLRCRKLSKEHKRKIRESSKGHFVSEKTREKIGLGNKGKIRTIEHRKKYSEAKQRMTKETRKKISKALSGRKLSEETKQKMIKNCKGMLGKHHTSETKMKLRISHLGKNKGEKNWHWKGGYVWKLYLNRKRRGMKLGAMGTHTPTEWNILREQYNFTCPACKKKEPFLNQYYVWLTEDHIVPLTKGGSDYIENIQPLCWDCNSKKNNKTISIDGFIGKDGAPVKIAVITTDEMSQIATEVAAIVK